MNNSQMIWVGRHEGMLRDVARGCAYGDPESIMQCAHILMAFVKDNSVLIPMPSHIGYATTMLTLCSRIRCLMMRVGFQWGIEVCDCLKCTPHESSHIVKLHNGVAPQFKMHLNGEIPKDKNIIVIDNTIATGATAKAALDVIPNAIVLALTKG